MTHAMTQILFLATGLAAIGITGSTVMESWERIGAALRGRGPTWSDAAMVQRAPARQPHRRALRLASTSIEWATMKVA